MGKLLLIGLVFLTTQTAMAGQCQDFFWRGYIVNYLASNLLDGKSVDEVASDVVRLSRTDIDADLSPSLVPVLR